jgi:hypothetical protein
LRRKEKNMALSIGIVGLPNVGKSTLFNALTRAQNAASANYPFCTIEPNKAVVPVPDSRLAALAELVHPQQVVPATVDFVDIAGLVRGASQGEGLGNQFLANIRDCQAIVHVLRCFDDPDIVHVDGEVDPVRDAETIETELLLADLAAMERRAERLAKQAKGDKKAAAQLETARRVIQSLTEGTPAAALLDDAAVTQLLRETPLITAKPVIFVLNVDEAGLATETEHQRRARDLAARRGAQAITVCARMEEELAGLSPEEAAEFLASYGVTESGLDQVIRAGYATLGLISFFTAGPKEVRAWTIREGAKAPQAAGVIHSDFERGFIRAEVIAFADYVRHGSEAKCRAAGVLRVEGKEYVVRDGDVMHFLFNV